jgi:hypothetical protein
MLGAILAKIFPDPVAKEIAMGRAPETKPPEIVCRVAYCEVSKDSFAAPIFGNAGGPQRPAGDRERFNA